MNREELQSTAQALVAKSKGIVAADESDSTIARRLESVNVDSTEENRRAWRQLLITTKGSGDYISGIILFDETIRQSTDSGQTFVDALKGENIIPGIKVDKGAHPMEISSSEKLTKGLDGLYDLCLDYYKLGARFAKWRAVITIGDDIPTSDCIQENASALAKYARACQDAELVPIVEPEVLMDGDHTIERCYEVSEKTLKQHQKKEFEISF